MKIQIDPQIPPMATGAWLRNSHGRPSIQACQTGAFLKVSVSCSSVLTFYDLVCNYSLLKIFLILIVLICTSYISFVFYIRCRCCNVYDNYPEKT